MLIVQLTLYHLYLYLIVLRVIYVRCYKPEVFWGTYPRNHRMFASISFES